MLLVVAWDGAGFDEVDAWIRQGDLPHLARLAGRGSLRPLRSTWPPVTFPAWTSFMTAADPSHHGVTDFTVREGSSYEVRFVNASWRHVPTIWRELSDAALKVGVYGFPATYPPEPLALQVCGFDTPLGAVGALKAAQPEGLAQDLLQRYGALGIEGPDQTSIGSGWHEQTLAFLQQSISRRTQITEDLLRERSFDVFAVHYMESDTVSHHFRQFTDPDSPRFRATDSEQVREALRSVYRALDDALGRLIKAAGPQATVMLVSDHGSAGSGDRVVFWNRWLADTGFLSWKQGAGVIGAGAGLARKAALRMLPAAWSRRLFAMLPSAANWVESGRRFGGIDWSNTQAFSEELNYNPSIWLNIKGREPAGCLAPQDVPGLVSRLTQEALSLRDPLDDGAVVERVWRREELYGGPHLGRLPDLLLELRRPNGYAYLNGPSLGGREPSPVRRLRPSEASGAKGVYMAGCHDSVGLCLVAGPNIAAAREAEGRIEEAGATLAALADPQLAGRFQAKPWSDLVDASAVAALSNATAHKAQPAAEPYSEEEEAEVRARLRDLGYLQ